MRIRATAASLFQEGDVTALDPKLQRLMQICNIQEVPPVHTTFVPLERIIIANEAQVKPSARFLRSIALLGIRQPPSIAFVRGTAWDADDAFYEVVMGRRRAKSARLLLTKGDTRFQTIKCEVYERSVPRLNAFLGLVENDQRSESWMQDVISLRELITQGIPMTLDDLKHYGFNARTIRGRLNIALLPSRVLDQICAGAVSQEVALQITRLSKTECERLDALCHAGEALTPDLVKSLLKRQVNQGLASVHTNLSQAWSAGANDNQAVSSTFSSPFLAHMQAAASEGFSSISLLLTLLRQFEAHMGTTPMLQRAGILVRVLIKELEIVQRSQAVHLAQQEEEPTHV